MKTKTYKTYRFNELSKEAQQQAIEHLYDINVDHSWWRGIYEDAKNIGLEITSCDFDRNCEGKLNKGIALVMEAIIKDHGKTCKTHLTAKTYLELLNALDVNDPKFNDKFDQIAYDFAYALKEDYRIMLSKEYDYLTSNKRIIETIECNEFDFLENGTLD